MRRLLVALKNFFSIPYRVFFTHIAAFCVLQEAKVDKTAAICSGVRFYRGKLGRYSYIGNNSFVIDTDIGNFTSISTDCYIGGTSHPMDWVSTSPVFHRWGNIMKKNFAHHDFEIFHRTAIGNDVWIGNRVMVKSGVTIGDGAVIGMGSVVTKDVGAYEIWAGNPARKLRSRFDEETVERLKNSEWWNRDDDTISALGESFNDVNQFLERYK